MLSNAILSGLIALGMSYSFVNLDGPFALFSKVRGLLSEDSKPEWVRTGSTCMYCLSFYTALFASILIGDWSIYSILLAWLGGFGFATFLLMYTGH